jgi:hypothetical protein
MRKILILLLAFLVLAPLVYGQEFRIPILGAGPPGPWDGGIFTGFLTVAVSYGLFIAGGAVISLDFGTGLVLFEIGSIGMPIGGLIWNIFLDQRNAAYKLKKLKVPEGDRAFSWTLTYISLGCAAGAVALPFLINDFLWSMLSGVILGGAAAIFETWNTLGPRTAWTKGLDATIAGKKISEVDVRPVLTLLPATRTRPAGTYIGVNVSL